MKKNKKQKIFIGTLLSLSMVLSLFNFVSIKQINGIDISLNSSLVKEAHANWEAPTNGETVACAITTGNPGGSFLYLICTSENNCLWGYEPYVRNGTCNSLGL
jgi:hypothetical protein